MDIDVPDFTYEDGISVIEFNTENAQLANPAQEANSCNETINPIAGITATERKRIMLQHELWPKVVQHTNAH